MDVTQWALCLGIVIWDLPDENEEIGKNANAFTLSLPSPKKYILPTFQKEMYKRGSEKLVV